MSGAPSRLGQRPAATEADDDVASLVCQAVAVALAGLSCAFALCAQVLLPERFLRDSNHIVYVMNSPVGHADDAASFRNIATFYRALHLNEQPALTAFLTLLVFAVTVFAAARWSELSRFGLIGLGVLAICFLCASVYLTQYSKESIPLLLVLWLMIGPDRRWWEAAFLVLAVLYAVAFRPYWAIVAVFYVVWRVLLPRRPRPLVVCAVLACGYLVLQVLFAQFLGLGLTDNRYLVNEGRGDVDVGSLITDPLPSHPLLVVPNAMLLLGFLLVPLPLLMTGSPFHAVSAAMIGFLWVSPLLGSSRPSSERPTDEPAGPAPSSHETRRLRSASLLLAMVFVQAIFEPDFGSYLKHLTPLMPLFLTMVPKRPAPCVEAGPVPATRGSE